MRTSRLLCNSPDSPSFGSFSNTVDLAAIAARVVEELRDEEPQSDSHHADDFEFAFHCDHRRSDPIATADEIFCNGQIRPSNPYATLTSSPAGEDSPADVEAEDGSLPPQTTTTIRRRRPPLSKLMSEERDSAAPTESDEDLVGVSPETYCVWTPKRPSDGDSGEDRPKELSSTPSEREMKSSSEGGSSKRWKLRSLLYARSTSDGKEKFVIVTPVKKTEKSTGGEEKEKASPESGKCGGEESEEAKRRGYVPYGKDMVGILRNVNGLSRHLRPF